MKTYSNKLQFFFLNIFLIIYFQYFLINFLFNKVFYFRINFLSKLKCYQPNNMHLLLISKKQLFYFQNVF